MSSAYLPTSWDADLLPNGLLVALQANRDQVQVPTPKVLSPSLRRNKKVCCLHHVFVALPVWLALLSAYICMLIQGHKHDVSSLNPGSSGNTIWSTWLSVVFPRGRTKTAVFPRGSNKNCQFSHFFRLKNILTAKFFLEVEQKLQFFLEVEQKLKFFLGARGKTVSWVVSGASCCFGVYFKLFKPIYGSIFCPFTIYCSI
jgi:hypothetical protein